MCVIIIIIYYDDNVVLINIIINLHAAGQDVF